MRHLDEGTIHAWLDGALSSEESAGAEEHVASCSTCAAAVAEARGFIAASSRILTALDAVPSIRPASGTGSARWGRRSFATWLVRERIAAVMTLVVAGGALALVMARDTPEASRTDLASEPVRAFDVAVADSPAPPPAAAREARNEAPRTPSAGVRAEPRTPALMRDLAATREADSMTTLAVAQQAAPTVTTNAAAGTPTRTDDALRPAAIAEAKREEALGPSPQATSSVAEKVTGALGRRRGADASARFSEPSPAAPNPAAAAVGRAAGAAAPAVAAPGEGARLVQEERMMEGGREVRRRIYRVDDLLVTLDERLPVPAEGAMEERAANAAQPDSATASTTIRWTDASGKELTLTGPAPQARLERIRKLLGY